MAKETIDYSKPLKNAKHERFCQEYVKDNNAKRSAITAGYSPKTAESMGSQLLRILKVAGRLEYLQAQLSEKSGVTALMVIEELAKVGFANLQDYISDGNEIVDLSGIKRDLAAAVESIQVDIRHDGGQSKGYTEKVKLKLHSKLSALTDLGKHLGIYNEDNKQKTENLADFLKAMKNE